MKNLFFYILAFYLLLTLVACNGTNESNDIDKQETTEELKGIISIDLNPYNFPLIALVPDSALAPLEIKENSWGGLEIRAGKYFQIQIAEEGIGMELKKSDLNGDMYTNTIIEEEPNYIIYKSEKEGLETMYHFYTILNIEGLNYEIKDIELGNIFPENAVRKMLNAAKQIKSSNPPS